MRSIVAVQPIPAWSSALTATRSLTIKVTTGDIFDDSPALFDLHEGVVWLDEAALGDDVEIDRCIREAITAVINHNRPQLAVVGKEPVETPVEQVARPASRPALRLVHG